jgi:methyl-accepting chemotaxis protein
MIIHNPTDTTVEITLNGVSKQVAPKTEIVVEDSFGAKWLSVHAFLQSVAEVAEAQAKEVMKEVAEVVEEVKDVVDAVEEAVEEVVKEVKKAKKK